MNNLQTCIVLAGGLGTRLRSAVPDKPKCLAPIGSKSFLETQLSMLSAQGFNNFIISVGYLSEMVIAEVVRLESLFKIQTATEITPLGTGGAILSTMHSLGIVESVVANGDTFLDGDISSMRQPLDLANEEFARIAITHIANRNRYGGVTIENNRIKGFTEKGVADSGYINAGVYRLHMSIFSHLQPGTAFSFENSILPRLINQNYLTGTAISGDFTDIGVPEDYFRFLDKQLNTNAD